MSKIRSYPGWAVALFLALFVAVWLLGPLPARAAGGWTRVDDSSLGEFTLETVFAVSPTDVWAGGSSTSGEDHVHYNGETGETSKGDILGLSQVSDLWAAGPNEVYAVGKSGRYGYIFKYNGDTWSQVYKSAKNEFLWGVWGSGPNDIYAVGSSGTVVHYDGTDWTPMDSGTTECLYGIWGSGPNDVYAVGDSGTVVHYKDGQWTAVDLSGVTTQTLYGVWGSGPDNIFAVGDSGTILHYNGTAWTAMDSGSTSNLKGVWGSALNDVYAVGDSGIILHYNGTAWRAMDNGMGAGQLKAVSGSGNEVYAVGLNNGAGIIIRHTVTADVFVTGVTLSPKTLALNAGETGGLTATLTPLDATDQSVQWSSGDESVATVDANGTVTAVSPGDTAITVTTTDGGFTASCAVTVNTAPSPIGAPVITPDGGFYETPQEVIVSIQADLTENQAIYYNTDESELSVARSVYYTAPFALQLEQGAITVKAAVYDSGSGQWSGVSQAVFTVTGASGSVAPAVTGVSPAWGPFAGGTIVTLNGANLSTVEAVYFGSNAGTGLNIKSDTSLTVASPAGSGTVDVIASGPNGASAASSAARFAYRASAGEITGEPVIATLPGSDTVLPFELYPGQRGFSNEPCFITVPAGTGQITIKKDPAKAITSLTVRDAGGNAFPADKGQPYSVTVPATVTREAPYQICYEYDHYIKNIYFYCVEENAPNPFVTPYSALTVPEGEAISLNVTGVGAPPQAVEWYYGYNKDSTYEKIYQKLEGKTGAALDIAISQDALNLGYLNETYGQYYLCFYAKIGGYISNQVWVTVNETSVTGARSLEASNWGSYAGARQWLNLGAAFGNTVAADTPVKFYLTAVANGTPDTAVAGTLLETTVAAVPTTAAYGEKDIGFLVGPLPAGDYWLALQLGTGETASYRYRPFTVYPGVKEYVKAALDKMISYYQNIWLIQNGKYVGLSERIDQFGTDWIVWMLCNYGHTVSDSLMAGEDGKTYLDSLEEILSNREQRGDENSAKDGFRFVCALCAAGADPRDFNGRNLVTELLSRAYDKNGSLKLDENGALVGEVDILSASYLMLGAEIAGATEAEGYTDALKKAGIKRILPNVERAVNASSADDIMSTDWLAMMSYPLYFLQDDDEYGARITAAIGKMADLVSTYQYVNGGLNSGWPGASSEGSFDEPLTADDYGIGPNSMAVMLNALVLFGTTAEDLENEVWQEDYGTLITALLGLQTENGAIRYYSNSENQMATYQTLGALVELYTGKSCFVNARETYLSHYVPTVRVAGMAIDPSVTMAAGNTAVAAGDNSWTINVVTGTVKDGLSAEDVVLTGLPPGLSAAVTKGTGNTILVTVSGTAGQAVNSLTTVSVVVKGGAVTEPGMADSLPVSVHLSPAALSAGQVTVTGEQKDITLDRLTPAATVVVPESVTGARINLAPLLAVAGGGKTAALPADLTIQADTAAGRIRVEIPAGTVISATASWPGVINVPSVRSNDSVAVIPDFGKTATVNSVIEIGFDDTPLTFDKAVRILVPGQAGKDAGYYRGGKFTRISNVMSADSQAAGDALLTGGDGRIDVGADLVIWTKHFTRFVTYTQSAANGSGGEGGGSANVTVNIRVEGYNDTLAPRTSVSVDNFDLTPYLRKGTGGSAEPSEGWGPDKLPKPTVAHALVKTLWSRGLDFDLQDYGWSLYVAMINGERELDHRGTSGWMYRVNDVLPNVGCQEYTLKGDEDIVWYFAAYGYDTWYSKLAASKTSAKTGEELTLTLTGSKTTSSGSTTGTNLKGAAIYVNGEEYKPEGTAIVTDENGKAAIKFNSAGTYEVSAERFNGEGYRDIVRPLPVKITVSGNTVQGSAGSAPVSDAALDDAIKKAAGTGLVALHADSAQEIFALSQEQLDKISKTGRPLAVTVQGVQFILSADSLKVAEITAKGAAQLQLKAQKLNAEETQSLAANLPDGAYKLAGDIYELSIQVINKDGIQQNIKQLPDCRILLPVPETARKAAAAGRITAGYYNEESKTWEEVGGSYDAAAGTFSFKVEHFSKYALLETITPAGMPPAKTFQDIAGHWAQKEIEFMAAKEYVAGVGDNQFAPEAQITRAQFAVILARMAGLTADADGAGRFSDVPDGAWYRGQVGAAVNAGLVYGTGENSFTPDEPITREQMAAMMARLMTKNGLDTDVGDTEAADLLAVFDDAGSISSWARTSVALMAREKLMFGRESNQFAPLGSTTRAEAAVVLCRMQQKLPQLGK